MPEINFLDTKVAFASKNNFALNKAFLLFKLMSVPSLVKVGSGLASFGIKAGLPINKLIKLSIFEQFCGGETINECQVAINNLAKYGIGTILDYSVEGEESDAAFDQTCQEIIHTIEKAQADKSIGFAVFKVTGVASFELLQKISSHAELTPTETQNWHIAKARILEICNKAAAINQPVFIDAEESWIQPAIDGLAAEMMQKFNTKMPLIYNTIQLYRHDRLAYLKASHTHATKNGYMLGVKLVRGAYIEKERKRAENLGYPSPIQPTKAATDADYDAALEFCVQNIANIAICAGTHNQESTELLTQLMQKHGVNAAHPHICFSQLYGMSDNLSYNLSNAGYNVQKYLPYGPVASVLPYLIRRAQENTAMAGQMSRELSLIAQERKRRNS